MFSGRDSAKSCVVVLGSGNRELTTKYVVTEFNSFKFVIHRYVFDKYRRHISLVKFDGKLIISDIMILSNIVDFVVFISTPSGR